MKEWKRKLSGWMVPAVVAMSMAALPVFAEETIPPAQIQETPDDPAPVTEERILSTENFGNRLKEIQGKAEVTKIILEEGTHTLTGDNLGQITKAGLTIEGAGPDKTIIDCAGKLTSGSGGIVVESSNVTIKGLRIKTSAKFSGSKALLKVGKTAASSAVNPDRIGSFKLENAVLEGDKDSAVGVEINSVDGFALKDVTISNGAKAGISVTSGTNGALSGVTTTANTGGSVEILNLKVPAPAPVQTQAQTQTQPKLSSVKLGSGNKFNEKRLYIERITSGEVKSDCGTITGEVPDGYGQTIEKGTRTVFAPLTDMVGKADFDQSFKLFGKAELTAPLEVSGALTIENGDKNAAVSNKNGGAFSVKAGGKLTIKNVDMTAKESCVVNAGETIIEGSVLKADGVILKNTAAKDKMKATNVVLIPGTYEEGKVLAENIGELTGKIQESKNQFWNIKLTNDKATMTKDKTISFVTEASALLADANGNPAQIKVETPDLANAYQEVDEEAGKKVTYSVVLNSADATKNIPENLAENTLLQAFSITIEKTVDKEDPVKVTPAKDLGVKVTVPERFVMAGIQLFFDNGEAEKKPVAVTVTPDAENRLVSFRTKDFGKFWLAGQLITDFKEKIVLNGTYHGYVDGSEGDYAVVGRRLSVALEEIPDPPAEVTPEAEEPVEPVKPVITYQWYRSTEDGFKLLEKATSATYTPVKDDAGKSLKVYVNKDGAVKFSDEIAAAQILDSECAYAPDAPSMYNSSDRTITLNKVTSDYKGFTVEYGIEERNGDISWQSSTQFTGLSPNTRYYFYTRYAATGVYAPSEVSSGKALWTAQTSNEQNWYNNKRPNWGGIYIPGSSSSDIDPINFNDMDNHGWASPAVRLLSSKGIIKGTSAYTFSPADYIKRGDFILMLDRMLGLNNVITSNFDDVPKDAYYADAIGRARSLGIIKGYDYSNFAPEDLITRQDIITMAYRAFNKKGLINTSYNSVTLDRFADKNEIAEYAAESLISMTEAGIIIGNESNLVQPRATATRAEIAVMCYRLYDLT